MSASQVPSPSPQPDEAIETIGDHMIDAAPSLSRTNFERGMNPFPPVPIALILTCIAVFIWQLTVGALTSEPAIIDAGALHRTSVVRGEAWRLVTCMFLHGDPTHLIGNMALLYILGMGCEHAFGWWRMVLLYTTAGIAGSILSVSMHEGPSVGASGAIFGLAGAFIVFLYRFSGRLYLRDKRVGFVVLFWACYTVAIGFLAEGIDNFAHIGGFCGGAIIGSFLPPRSTLFTHDAAFDVVIGARPA